MNRLLQILLPGNNLKSLKDIYKSSAFRSLFVQSASAVLVFAVNLVLARLMPLEDYSAYTFAFTLCAMLAGIATSGLQNLLIKKSAEYISQNKYSYLNGLLKWSNKKIIIALTITSAAIIIAIFIPGVFNNNQKTPLLIALAALPVMCLLIVYQSVLNGAQLIQHSQVPERLVKPFITVIFCVFAFAIHNQLDAMHTSIINLLAFIVTLVITYVFMKRYIYNNIIPSEASYEESTWKTSFYNLFFLSVIAVFNGKINTLIIGFTDNPQYVAVYNVAGRIAELIMFTLFVLNMNLAPVISKHHSSGKLTELQVVVNKFNRFLLIITLPLLLIIVAGSEYILGLFGKEFLIGKEALIILAIGQFIYVLCGTSGYLLTMTGNEKHSLRAIIIAAVINIAACSILVPIYGINGAAIASSLSLVSWNIYSVVIVRKITGIKPTLFG